MRILAIETSCDETAIAIVEAQGAVEGASFRILGNALLSQVEVHREYGGVFPALAKREHAKNLMPILEAALEEAELLHEDTQIISEEMHNAIAKILEREPGLTEAFFEFVNECEPPAVDAIAVTTGPGLEPALWVGINFARALALVWSKPIVAVNHMEGHIMAALAEQVGEELEIRTVNLPVLALLISGGHTELVLMREWLTYELIGQTRDDAVGEAYDKVARMLSLPYPGGPEVSKLSESLRNGPVENPYSLPRPMLDSGTCDFSFAGLKTAVLYLLKSKTDLSEHDRQHVAHEFENAVADVLWKKTARALEETGAQTLVIGGGVSANTNIRRVFKEKISADHSHVTLRIPTPNLTTDNAIMIALAGFYRAQKELYADSATLTANGNLKLASGK
jgi:N6-L-threonylcarbamoyladenine synthase